MPPRQRLLPSILRIKILSCITMNKIKYLSLLALLVAIPFFNSCDDPDEYDDLYTEWYNKNVDWLAELENKRNPDGTAYYTRHTAPWDPNSYVLIHYFGERNIQNLKPLYTSTVDMRYHVELCDGTGIDSSANIVEPMPGVFRAQLNSGLIAGWPIAVTDMHVGDTCEVIIPFTLGYGVAGAGTVPPYSNLRFNLRLVDIPYYEARP